MYGEFNPLRQLSLTFVTDHLIVVGMALLLLGLCGAGWSVRSGARVP